MKNKINSLLIDEKPDRRIQFYLSLDLLKVNRACVCQDNSFDALAYMKQHPDFLPDYIFISATLPKEYSKLFIRQIRKMEDLATVPVILMAATEGPLKLAETSEDGFTDVLLKQPDIYSLKEALQRIFEKNYELPQFLANSMEELYAARPLLEAPHRISA
ncbi:hypothetical protein ACDQ55_14165 [Chitinophaga sp. 30R24]|uniref:hypothetical protein n=1 Tax=Chitinophaga sp. 30R24 TaxID=3248838 RepID=UPI003B8F46C5